MIIFCPFCGSSEVYLVVGAGKYVCKSCKADFSPKELRK